MHCPVCKTTTLEEVILESQLSSLKCSECAGKWIKGATYWNWLETHKPQLPEHEFNDSVVDVGKAKLCPECKSIMVKYWVGHGVEFSLDHCHSCRGIWFDRNEWEVLKSRNLHDDINSIFTAPWQTKIEKEHRRNGTERRYLNKFGVEDYAEMKRVQSWIRNHQRREEILAFLSNPNLLD
ncbi:MAG: zf-TFIIB domain-containing protein [Pyrinomonadaceae bacterium]